MAEPAPRIPSIDDIRWLFEQLQIDPRTEGGPKTPPPPPAGGHEETSHD